MSLVKARGAAARALSVALLMLALAPAGAQAFSKAIWGPITHNGKSEFPLYHKLGVRIYQTDLVWASVAPTRPSQPTNPGDPAYHWPAAIQQAVSDGQRYGIRVLLQVLTAPPWANKNRSQNYPPSNPADYAAFITAAAREYPDVHLWMVWGEPDRQADFGLTRAISYKVKRLTHSEAIAPHTYARILNDAYGALKSVSRRNLVIGGNTSASGDMTTFQWLSNLKLPNGKPPRMDMWGHNPFSAKDPSFSIPYSRLGEVQFSDLHELAGWLDHYIKRGLPLFLSEFTIPTRPDQEFPFYVDPGVAAKWTRDALRLSRHWKRIYSFGWIHLYDDPPVSYGGLLTVRGKPKPDYYAFEHG
jgi:hypothetical protein